MAGIVETISSLMKGGRLGNNQDAMVRQSAMTYQVYLLEQNQKFDAWLTDKIDALEKEITAFHQSRGQTGMGLGEEEENRAAKYASKFPAAPIPDPSPVIPVPHPPMSAPPPSVNDPTIGGGEAARPVNTTNLVTPSSPVMTQTQPAELKENSSALEPKLVQEDDDLEAPVMRRWDNLDTMFASPTRFEPEADEEGKPDHVLIPAVGLPAEPDPAIAKPMFGAIATASGQPDREADDEVEIRPRQTTGQLDAPSLGQTKNAEDLAVRVLYPQQVQKLGQHTDPTASVPIASRQPDQTSREDDEGEENDDQSSFMGLVQPVQSAASGPANRNLGDDKKSGFEPKVEAKLPGEVEPVFDHLSLLLGSPSASSAASDKLVANNPRLIAEERDIEDEALQLSEEDEDEEKWNSSVGLKQGKVDDWS